jgi:hypothetical protein
MGAHLKVCKAKLRSSPYLEVVRPSTSSARNLESPTEELSGPCPLQILMSDPDANCEAKEPEFLMFGCTFCYVRWNLFSKLDSTKTLKRLGRIFC